MKSNLHGYEQEWQRQNHKPETIISDRRFIKLRCVRLKSGPDDLCPSGKGDPHT